MSATTKSRRRWVVRVATAAATTLGAIGLVSAPVNAYGNMTFRFVKILNTSTCATAPGSRPVIKVSGGCRANDAADDTVFLHDSGGHPAKLELLSGGVLRAKAEFHPKGQKLMVYDTSNDGDMIYFELRDRYTDQFLGIYYPPGTSKVLDKRTYLLPIAEGRDVSLIAFDSKSGNRGTERLTHVVGRA